jgi:hypothetical protein
VELTGPHGAQLTVPALECAVHVRPGGTLLLILYTHNVLLTVSTSLISAGFRLGGACTHSSISQV